MEQSVHRVCAKSKYQNMRLYFLQIKSFWGKFENTFLQKGVFKKTV